MTLDLRVAAGAWIGLVLSLWPGALAASTPPPDLKAPLQRTQTNPADAAVILWAENYEHLTAVPYAQADAELMAWVLQNARGIPAERVKIVEAKTRDTMTEAVAEGARLAGKRGTLWVYFAGHGLADPERGVRSLAAEDASRSQRSFSKTWIPIDELSRHGIAAGHSLFIVDSCYNGYSRSGDALVRSRSVSTPDLAREALPENLTLWWGADEGQTAEPYEAAEHGAFTYFVAGALRGWADGALGRRDHRVTLREADQFVTAALTQVGAGQRPLLQVRASQADWAMSAGKGRMERSPDLSALATMEDAHPPGSEATVNGRAPAAAAEQLSLALNSTPTKRLELTRDSVGWFRSPQGLLVSREVALQLYHFQRPAEFAYHTANSPNLWTVAPISALCGPLEPVGKLSQLSGIGPVAVTRSMQSYYVDTSGIPLQLHQVHEFAVSKGIAEPDWARRKRSLRLTGIGLAGAAVSSMVIKTDWVPDILYDKQHPRKETVASRTWFALNLSAVPAGVAVAGVGVGMFLHRTRPAVNATANAGLPTSATSPTCPAR